jgi:hypothetical protein
MRKGLILLFILMICWSLFGVPSLYAGVPQMINYQGTLTDKNGAAVPNGNYNLLFKIYDVASGGAALWTEKWDTTTSQITVVGGIFNAMLGFQNPIPASFFADHPVTYLGITVGTDSEMLPRQQITSVGYAFTAGNGVPKGGIIMWSGAIDQVPDGWALCDGVERTLYDGTKITPPNLKDKFVMGAGGGYAVAASGGTSAINLAHTHAYSGSTGMILGEHSNRSSGSYDTAGDQHYHEYSGTTGAGGNSTQDILPPYYALAFIMKL